MPEASTDQTEQIFKSPEDAARALYAAIDFYRAEPTDDNARAVLELKDQAADKFGFDDLMVATAYLDKELGFHNPDAENDNPYEAVLAQLEAESAGGTFDDDTERWDHQAYDPDAMSGADGEDEQRDLK